MKIRLSVLFAAWMAAWAAFADTVPEDQRVPIDLRRTTLVVADMERSLEFYRDALGMAVIYDNLIVTPPEASREDADLVRRLVFLRANDDYIGVLGLLQYFKPVRETVDLTGSSFKQGTAVMLFNVEDLPAVFSRASAVEGVVIIDEPTPMSFPSYDGEASIEVMVSTLQDPDGFTVEVNELLSEIR